MSTTLALFLIIVCTCSANPILWAGGVTSTSAEFRVESDSGDNNFLLALEPDFCENSVIYTTPITNGLNAISVESLKPLTRYYYAVDSDLNYFGEFQTFPPEGQHFSFNFTFGSCAFTGNYKLIENKFNSWTCKTCRLLTSNNLTRRRWKSCIRRNESTPSVVVLAFRRSALRKCRL